MDASQHGGGGGGEPCDQPHDDGMVRDGWNLPGDHDPRGSGRFSGCFGEAEDFFRGQCSVRSHHALPGGSFRDPSIVAEPEVPGSGQSHLYGPGDPDRVRVDRGPVGYGIIFRSVLETERIFLRSL